MQTYGSKRPVVEYHPYSRAVILLAISFEETDPIFSVYV
jgi:hypothetical protein